MFLLFFCSENCEIVYSEALNWTNLCDGAWELCGNGIEQSPVDIISTKVVIDRNLNPFHFQWRSTYASYFHNFSAEIDVKPQTDYTVLAIDNPVIGINQHYLTKISFNSPSEHAFNGLHSSASAKFILTDSNNTVDLIISLIFVQDASNTRSPWLDLVLNARKNGLTTIDISPSQIFTTSYDNSYYNYLGSTTTPPCTQPVTWLNFQTPISASVDQIQSVLLWQGPGNIRTLQPIGDRIVTLYSYNFDPNESPDTLKAISLILALVFVVSVIIAIFVRREIQHETKHKQTN